MFPWDQKPTCLQGPANHLGVTERGWVIRLPRQSDSKSLNSANEGRHQRMGCLSSPGRSRSAEQRRRGAEKILLSLRRIEKRSCFPKVIVRSSSLPRLREDRTKSQSKIRERQRTPLKPNIFKRPGLAGPSVTPGLSTASHLGAQAMARRSSRRLLHSLKVSVSFPCSAKELGPLSLR